MVAWVTYEYSLTGKPSHIQIICGGCRDDIVYNLYGNIRDNIRDIEIRHDICCIGM